MKVSLGKIKDLPETVFMVLLIIILIVGGAIIHERHMSSQKEIPVPAVEAS